uniref:Uncharacterized protein n=1 Tax=virus sp. ctQiC1 TaxID=2825817 RepID=A0A8S5RN23_9VIRU|nr:MAG TPA: hypothetical protein [virus sp. ctQiC1]
MPINKGNDLAHTRTERAPPRAGIRFATKASPR